MQADLLQQQSEQKRNIDTMKKVLNIARNDPIALDGFLASLGGQTNEEQLQRIKELEEAAEIMKEKIATLEAIMSTN